jgi:ubiquinone/menaquinone biosynthesis C-methylase UbiE
VDVHQRKDDVTGKLRDAGVSAALHTASAEDLPFEDRTFDVAVAVSTLEFVGDISRAAREISRVLPSLRTRRARAQAKSLSRPIAPSFIAFANRASTYASNTSRSVTNAVSFTSKQRVGSSYVGDACFD